MTIEASIYPGYDGGRVGTITLDVANVRGEGGPYDPRLVLPLTIALDPQDEPATLALTRLSCALHLREPSMAAPYNQVGPSTPVLVDQLRDRLVASTPKRLSAHQVEARLFLSPPALAQLEAHRHTDPAKVFVGALSFDGTLAWTYKTTMYYTDATPGPHRFARDEWPFDFRAGASLTAEIWTTRIEPLALRIPASTWVDNVLPGLGLDRLRLIEITLPVGGGPLPVSVVSMFDDAQRDYDAGRYRECVGKCRDVRHAVEQHLGATKAQPVADVVAAQLALPAGAAERTFLDGAWKALGDLTNSAHHIGTTGAPSYSAAATRTCLFLTATLLDYMRHLYMPPPIGRHP